MRLNGIGILVCLSWSMLTLSVIARQAESAGQSDEPKAPLADRPIRVLDLHGSPYERGLAHGKALKSEIQEMIRDFKRDLKQSYDVDAATFIQQFLAETDFQPAIEKSTPGLLDEVRGIGDGAEVPFDEIYTYQLLDEIWSMGRWAVRDKCTAIAVSRRGDQPTIVAQNMDIPGFHQKYPTLLRIHSEDGPDQLVLTCPGLIGVNGMNSSGVAVCCNTLLQLKPSQQAIPCLFLVRGVLAKQNLAEAEAWMKEVPHAVGQNYTLGDRDAARAIECSSSRKEVFLPQPNADFTYHTNHPLVNTEWHPDYLERCQSKQCTPEEGMGVCHRLVTLQNRLQPGQPITEELIVELLASREHAAGSICGDWTYACTIFVLGERPELHIAPGRPDRYRMQTFGFE